MLSAIKLMMTYKAAAAAPAPPPANISKRTTGNVTVMRAVTQ